MESVEPSSLTRGQFLRVAGGAAAGLLGLGPEAAAAAVDRAARRSGGHSGLYHTFHSRPNLHPPRASVVGNGAGAAARQNWFLTANSSRPVQNGPLILDPAGRPVWFKSLPRGWYATNLRTQRYRGQTVLTWFEGTILGAGEGVIADTSYREIARVRAGNGRQVDPHELLLTPQGTALITCVAPVVEADLSSVGGSKHGQVSESVIQEVDIQSGRLVLEWRSLEHVPVSESYMWAGGGVYDYMHANSIDITPDGNLLVSGRHTWALYKLERSTGRVIWRLGGKRSDFEMGPGAQFAWQHDGRQIDERTFTVFDDGAAFFVGNHRARTTHRQSRGLRLELDHGRRRVRLATAYVRHPPLLTAGYGGMQTLPNGQVVVSWGNLPVATHFDASGARVVQELDLATIYSTYRAYRLPWVGAPADPPRLAARRDRRRGTTTLYASWNGATECAAWALRTGSSPSGLRRVRTAPRTGFETAIKLPLTGGYVQVTALDRTGRPLARSAPKKL